jgi:endonuclease YncB( thermonuclease family)
MCVYRSRMPAVSAVLFCVVVGITDGDTLTARCDPAADVPAKTIKVRLAEVDAPEHHQPFGARSRETLSSLCVMQSTEVRPIAASAGLDRYGRTVAHVNCNGIDANREQVRAGMAWVYPRYVTDRRLYALQDEARASRRGLWADAKPLAPWEWRRGQHNVEHHAGGGTAGTWSRSHLGRLAYGIPAAAIPLSTNPSRSPDAN